MSNDFPQSHSNHAISRASKEALAHHQPPSWIVNDLGSADDYGFDLQVQVTQGGGVAHVFLVQLKGTTAPDVSKDGLTIRFSLRRRTLNLYAQAAPETMLVVVDVRFQANGKVDVLNSPAYYCWISDELRRLRGSRFEIDCGAQDEFTVHVPVSQQVTPELDVGGLLDAELRRRQATETLEDIARKAMPAMGEQKVTALERLIQALREDPTKLAALISGSAAAQSEMSEPSSPVLREALGAIRAGATEIAEQTLDRFAATLDVHDPSLHADYLSLRGKVAFQRALRSDSLALFRQAQALHPAERFLLSIAEIEFLEAVDRDDSAGIEQIALQLKDVKTQEGISLLVRVLTSIGRISEAQAELERLDESKQRISRLVILSMQKDWLALLQDADSSLTVPDLASHDVLAINLIACRAAWQLAFSASEYPNCELAIVPITGVRGLDGSYVRRAWEHGRAAMTQLAALGWPPNVELLASTFTAVSCAMGKQKEAIDTLGQAQARRPEYQSLNENLELLAIATDDIELALDSNLRRTDNSEVLEKRALHLFRLKRLPEMLDIVDLLTLRSDAKPLLGLAVGRAAAKSLGRIADANRYESKLSEIDDGEFLFFSDATFRSITKEGLDPREVLRDGLRQHPDSILLAGNLLSNLRENLASEAAEIPPLARLMRRRQELGVRDWEHVVRAHLTLGEGAEAEREATQAIAKFGRRAEFLELLAVACEMQGRTADALRFIDEAISGGASNRAVFRNLFSLSVRLGRRIQPVDATH